MSIEKSLDRLRDQSGKLKEKSARVNARLLDVESQLIEAGVRRSTWVFFTEGPKWFLLGFERIRGDWMLTLREVEHLDSVFPFLDGEGGNTCSQGGANFRIGVDPPRGVNPAKAIGFASLPQRIAALGALEDLVLKLVKRGNELENL